jgi:steroid 5-alpha reductase family enzyme
MIHNPWIAVAIGAGGASLMMAALWAVQVWIGDATHVDVAWAYGIGAVGIFYAAVAEGDTAHRALVGTLVGLWSARLGTYLVVNRLLGKPEDGRYRALREKWGARANRRFFVFFQAQAFFILIFSVPLVLAAYNGSDGLEPLEIAGAVLWTVALAGEVTADVQLARWRANPVNRGKTCRAGLWRVSRHPNYFFEWLIWIAFALIASAAPWGWLGFMTPAFLLALLFRVTGIPATEEQNLRSRGDDYRRYQRETPVFVPWFPKRPRSATIAG